MRQDTIRLLQDCSLGLHKTGASIDSVLPRIKDPALRKNLRQGQALQKDLLQQTGSLLRQHGAYPRSVPPLTTGLRQLRADLRLGFGGDDTVAAQMVASDCDTGLKALCRSRNRYITADRSAIALADSAIGMEAKLSAAMRPFL